MPSENIFRRHYKICSPFQMSNVHPYTIFATMLHKSTAKDILIMSYDLSKRLVIGLASSALFDLSESDNIFRTEGAETYRQYQREKQNHPLKEGVAFPFIKKLLSINEINPNDPPIEVILLSRNDPDTGLRVMNSIEAYGLDITRALFLQGGDPHRYIKTLSIDLFLSANEVDVRQAITAGYPAGHVLASHFEDGCLSDSELRIALDFDGVLIDDSSEKIYADQGIRSFQEYELKHSNKTHNSGPLTRFLKKLSEIQIQEKDFSVTNRQYKPKLRIAIITARNAPSHKRVINTMRSWGITVNEAFFLGGIEKRKILEVLKPHIFFDDQKTHLDSATEILPSVHIPFGIRNKHNL